MKKFIFSNFAGLQAYSRQLYYQMNSFASIFPQHFKTPPHAPPMIDLSPSSHQILKSPPYSQHLWETLYPVLYPDIFSHCWISISISKKYVKQVLINNSWILPTFGKIVEEWRLLRENEVYLLIFVFLNPRNIEIPGTYIKVKLLLYTQIYEIRF